MNFKQIIEHVVRRRIVAGPAILVLGLAAQTARAELRFAQSSVHVGEIRTGMPLAHRFGFVNDGPQPAEITDMVSSCGCLTPRFEQRVYRPGESGSVLLEIHTLSQTPGPHTWSARVRWRSGSTMAETALQLTGHVISEVSVQPAALTIFADSAVANDISLTDIRPQPFAVRAVLSTSTRLTTQITKQGRDSRGHRTWTVHLAVADDFPAGRHYEAVTVYTDDPAYRDLRLPVTIIKNPRQQVAALPNLLVLTAAPDTPLPSQLVRLRDRTNRPVHVDRIVADSPAITTRWAPGPDTMATLKVMVDQKQLNHASLRSAVHVYISKPVRETVTIGVEVVSSQ
jgi:hypothetical protein